MHAPTTPDPHAAYADRLAARRAEADRLAAAIDRLGQLRLAVVLAAVGAAGRGVGHGGLLRLVGGGRGGAVTGPGAAVEGARLPQGRGPCGPCGTTGTGSTGWPASGSAAARPGTGSPTRTTCTPPTSTCSATGRCSSGCRPPGPPAGRRLLAGWLLAPASADEVRDRQEAVADLRDRLDLREYLAVVGGGGDGGRRRDAAGGVGPAAARRLAAVAARRGGRARLVQPRRRPRLAARRDERRCRCWSAGCCRRWSSRRSSAGRERWPGRSRRRPTTCRSWRRSSPGWSRNTSARRG